MTRNSRRSRTTTMTIVFFEIFVFSWFSFEPADAGVGGLAILRTGASGYADSADDLAVHQQRYAAFSGDHAAQRQEAPAFAPRGERVLQHLRRTLEPRRRARLVDGDVDARRLGAVHLFEVH